MQKLAFDVVLLPPKNLMDRIIILNHQLNRNYDNPRIVLGESCLLHISLLMGIIDLKYLSKIKLCLNSISENTRPIDLEIINLDYGDLSAKDRTLKIAGFEINKLEI